MTVILNPAVAANRVCHEEQLRIWADDHIIAALAMAGYIREDMSYDDIIDLNQIVMRELKHIIEMAFDHPEAATILRRS
jgi:hypothetical protein